MMIKPFELNTPKVILEDLKFRIRQARWPDEIAGSEWGNGTSLAFLKELSDYWLNEFDWRKIEAEINIHPNYMTDIDGCQIHYQHIKGKGPHAVPLIITHGWPGSFIELQKMIPLLTAADEISFDLVIPSVIGFGFSSKAEIAGCNSAFVAEHWHKLMRLLGYDKYVAQGGDIGSGISTCLALKYPDEIMGLHLNYISGAYKPYLAPGEILANEVIDFQRFAADWASREAAYAYLHSTKPLTLAYGLNDSPIGLCAWIVEKFNSWSDHGEDIYNVFTRDELLANVTLYWITRSIYSSMRIYKENRDSPLIWAKDDYVAAPVAFAAFPKELPTPPRSYVEKGYNIQRWTEMPAGGHFAAMEQPELLAADLRAFVKDISR